MSLRKSIAASTVLLANHFDVIRVENRLIEEHGDQAVIAVPATR